MQRLFITTAATPQSCQIVIGSGLLARLSKIIQPDQYSKIAVITDEQVAAAVLPAIRTALPSAACVVTIPQGEAAKTVSSAARIWEALLSRDFDRKSAVINLGGGMIGDLGGFAASTYMRGIDTINIPTTLLAMADASIGGKTGINFGGIKNLIGTFSQPKMVIMDTEVLRSLPRREFISGFAEIIKHGLIQSSEYFHFVTQKKPNEYNQHELARIVEDSCKIKAAIVQTDVHETAGKRKLLNFGHTVGHAIEAYLLAANKPILHGEAVAVGMTAEAKISQLLGFITENDLKQIVEALGHAGLPTSVSAVSPEHLAAAILHDKKNEFGVVKWTLLKSIGEGVADCEVPQDVVRQGLRYITQ